MSNAKRASWTNNIMIVAAFLAAMLLAMALSGCAGTNQQSSSAGSGPGASNEAVEDVTEDMVVANDGQMTAFAANSAPVILSGSKQNQCYSPASLYLALAMLEAGTDGNAQTQLLEALGFDSPEALLAYCKEEALDLEFEGENGKVDIANSIWANLGYTFSDQYTKILEDNFGAAAFDVEMGSETANAAISGWIAEQTQNLLNPQIQTTADQVAMLVNTIYFKDSWLSNFEESATQNGSFHAADGDMEVQFMHKTTDQGTYTLGSNYTAASLPFESGASMEFYLPNEGTTIDDLLSSPAAVLDMLKAEPNTLSMVEWSLPKFAFDSSYPALADAMKELGVTDVFDASNLGMFENMIVPNNESALDFYVSDILQETHIGLDENGVEAAAYTAIAMREMSLMEETDTVEFVLDRPFVYALKAMDGTPLFIGTVINPSA